MKIVIFREKHEPTIFTFETNGKDNPFRWTYTGKRKTDG